MSVDSVFDFNGLLMQADCKLLKDIQCERHCLHHSIPNIKAGCQAFENDDIILSYVVLNGIENLLLYLAVCVPFYSFYCVIMFVCHIKKVYLIFILESSLPV
jgi:hypothetical protein